MPHPTHRRTPILALLALTFVLLGPMSDATAGAVDDSDPASSADPPVEVSSGHVDIGPHLVDGRMRLMVRDDSGATPVWRDPERTVLRISDAARTQVPEDPLYSFLGVEPGESVHLMPQTQDPDVVWIGWNTQDPSIRERVGRGIDLTLLDVAGPGNLTVYLHSGNLGAPEVLWDARTDDPQSVWIEANTHSHANWVFTRPGLHVVRLEIASEHADGTRTTDVADLRIAVGDDERASDAGFDPLLRTLPDVSSGTGAAVADRRVDEPTPDRGSNLAPWLALAGAAAGVLVVTVTVGSIRSARMKRAARTGADT